MNKRMKSLFLSTKDTSTHSSQGFNMMEVLASVVIMGVAIVAVAPALIVAAASRLHSERVETASNLATQELERVQSLVARGVGNYVVADLPPAVANPLAAYPPPPTTLRAIDLDGYVSTDTQFDPDYYVSSFRFNNIDCANIVPVRPCAFQVGVFVYSRVAFNAGGAYIGTPVTAGSAEELPVDGSAGLEGAVASKDRPLVYSAIEVGSVSTLEELCQLGGGAPGTDCRDNS